MQINTKYKKKQLYLYLFLSYSKNSLVI